MNIPIISPTQPTATFTADQMEPRFVAGAINGWNMAVAAEPRPHVTTMGVIFNRDGQVFIFRRTDQVRSAKNCWSMVSGLHEIGLRFEQQLAVEAMEEFNIAIDMDTATSVGVYENIASEDGYHWVIHVAAVVGDFKALANAEPLKHVCLQLVPLEQLAMITGWSTGLDTFLDNHLGQLRAYRDWVVAGCQSPEEASVQVTQLLGTSGQA